MMITGIEPEALLHIFASDNREIVRITHSGQVVVNPEFTAEEAARAFWTEVQKLAAVGWPRARSGGPFG
jgi:hypothetical protein